MRPVDCRDCGTPLSARSLSRPQATGYCGKCAPKHHWTPESRARASAARSKRWAEELADPVKRAAAVASGKRISAEHPPTPERIAKQKAGRRKSFWLPEGYEEFNLQLKRKHFKVAERKVIILEEVERRARKALADEQARLAAMTPFERQMERVRNGAKLVDKFVPQRVMPAYTLGGVAPEAM